jgi:hypothetical protein
VIAGVLAAGGFFRLLTRNRWALASRWQVGHRFAALAITAPHSAQVCVSGGRGGRVRCAAATSTGIVTKMARCVRTADVHRSGLQPKALWLSLADQPNPWSRLTKEIQSQTSTDGI